MREHNIFNLIFTIMTLNAKQLAAVVKAGLLLTNADGKAEQDEYEIIVSEVNSFNVTREQFDMLLDMANNMSVEEMVDLLKVLSYEDKKYISGFLVSIAVIDQKVDPEEAKAWQAICSLCQFPEVSAEDALLYWRNH